jgi:selenocysteine-specific elongation factor
VVLLDATAIPAGRQGLVQLVLDRPIGALANDRFVLRDTSARRTLGGGRVLDPFPPQRRRRTPERLAKLGALTAAEPEAALRALLALPPGLIDLAAFARDRNLTGDETEEALDRSGALRLPGWAVGPGAWTGFREQVRTVLAAFHAANPSLAGMAQSQLRTTLPTRYPAAAFPAMLQALVKLGAVVVEANRVRLPTHSVRLAPEDQKLWAQIEPLLRRERFRPPRVRDVAGLLRVPEPRVRSLMKLMARLGRVEEIAQDHFFLRLVVDEMVRIAAEVGGRDPAGVVTAAAFRDRLDNGRKVAIQILEFFDAHGLTIRNGDLRRLRRDRLDRFADLPGA